jgi:hypothetical protein
MSQPTPVQVVNPNRPKFGLGHIVLEPTTSKQFVITGLPSTNLMVEANEPAYTYREFVQDTGPSGATLVRTQKSMEGGRFVVPGKAGA